MAVLVSTFLCYSFPSCSLSASCVHISGLLHALVAMNPNKSAAGPGDIGTDEEEAVPVTSRLCEWKQPCKQKENSLKMAEASFKKQVYGNAPKQKFVSLADFDPRPPQYRGNAVNLLPDLSTKMQGNGLCISLLFDPDTCYIFSCL